MIKNSLKFILVISCFCGVSSYSSIQKQVISSASKHPNYVKRKKSLPFDICHHNNDCAEKFIGCIFGRCF